MSSLVDSLNKKIIFAFVFLGLFLLAILFVQIVPTMQKEQIEYKKKQIDNMIYLTTQQLKLATKALSEQSKSKREYKRSIIQSKVENIESKLHNSNRATQKQYINEIAKEIGCGVYVFDENKNTLFQTIDEPLNLSELKANDWTVLAKNEQKIVCPKPLKGIYFTKISKHHTIAFACKSKVFSDKSMAFEYKLKKDIQNSFALSEDIHKGKIYLMWINQKDLKNSDTPVYDIGDDHYYNNKYCISKTSNLKFPRTGNLTGRQIVNAIDKEPIRHLLDKEDNKGAYIHEALTWVRSLDSNTNRRLLFITTVFTEDFDNKIDSSFWKILPATLIALLLAIGAGILIFRRVFKSINLLYDTAHKVNAGDISVRSNIKGEDDIGVLGTTFDSMLDSIERNITQLDNTVEQRTKELKSSLEEKEILLKEIHHRVKNNLAMIIELIKIQKLKLKDSDTKETLVDIQERVYTMELLHRKLYESKDLHFIDFKKYLNDLLEDLKHSYATDKDIKISLDMDNVNMSIEYALPCGLIINECVTNSFKYAFEKDHGNITISLRNDGSKYLLKISDDGKGIPDSVDINKPKTLGLKLISTIVKSQLMGEMNYQKEEGSLFIIEFEISQNESEIIYNI